MSPQPLEEFTVLDLSQGVAGPMAGAFLADFGAEVISIEPPGGGSQRRIASGSAFPNVSRNKRSIVINLKTDAGTEILYQLVKDADVLIHNNRPGKMADLDCDYETLKELNPQLVYCSITGYGESGPYKNRPGIDPLAQAVSGLMWMTGEPDRKPSRIGGPTIDYSAGINAAFACVTALIHANRTGEGQKVESSLFDTAASIMSNWYTMYSKTGSVPERQGHSWEVYAPSGVFETATNPVYLAIPAPPLWERFCNAMDRADWLTDTRFETNNKRIENREALTAELESEFQDYDRGELIQKLVEAGVPAAEVNTVPEAAEDDHLHQRGTVQEVTDQDGDNVLAVSTPVRFSETPGEIDSVSPDLGVDTRTILEEYGFDEEDISSFIDSDAVESSE